jgi:hypothetical protein
MSAHSLPPVQYLRRRKRRRDAVLGPLGVLALVILGLGAYVAALGVLRRVIAWGWGEP